MITAYIPAIVSTGIPSRRNKNGIATLLKGQTAPAEITMPNSQSGGWDRTPAA
jgi:hypothetical protein